MSERAGPKLKGSEEAGLSFALALGGGGARGLAHIHVLETLDELGIRPTAIAGSSIGAIMGAVYASGMTGREIHDYARSVLGRPADVAARMWKARSGMSDMVKGGLKVGQFNIERILRAFLPDGLPETFADLNIPLQVTATDFYGHQLHVCDEGDLISAIGASAALPALFEPVWRNDKLLIDGGFYDPVPFDLVMGKADIIVAIDVVGAPEPGERKTPGRVDLMYGASQLIMQSVIASKLLQSQPDILLRPPVSRFRALDFLKIDQLMAESESIKDDLKRAIDQAVKTRAI